MSVLRRADGWLQTPAPAERLAAFRVLAGGFALVYIAVRAPALWALTRRPDERFEAVGILAPLDDPPARLLVAVVLGMTLALGVAFTAGWRFRVVGPAFALSLLVITTFHGSWGQLLHFENLMTLHVLVLGFSPAADAWAVGSARAGRPPDPRYGWPLRLASIITVAVYFIAGVAKLRIGGLEWMLGDTLRNHVAYSAARLELLGSTPTPLARYAVEWAWMFPPMAVASVVLELAAPVALRGGRVRDLWVGATVLMHLAILALMAVFFPYQALGFAFAPMYAVEQGVARVRAWGRRHLIDRPAVAR